jgi:cell division protein FtsB
MVRPGYPSASQTLTISLREYHDLVAEVSRLETRVELLTRENAAMREHITDLSEGEDAVLDPIGFSAG